MQLPQGEAFKMRSLSETKDRNVAEGPEEVREVGVDISLPGAQA